ncbi:aminotransferase class I/II-fold pyridoxal phosphate-dependent enzyme [Nesterenkonia massiliensis]|uniref:Aminotransferase class I/II-fold pyridoxal phosphate-dependent enzyme n=1 Tax=Nesterenkonia massiliensis TaxID=1232429 RepID=A0ABT2HMQ0_9MICC|nr:aminotransferase class I/II-fold pyridoxal phosphate-dependent enzyme [Nesterenkonia massiliensis]MCT1605961.1 aminotransferase class I/II-fold pyridoxal phosphate-dependent enzyme [Nesterenkonia massiliensis]
MSSPWARAAAAANTYDQAAHAVLPTVYERTTAAALSHQAVNLGQGFPDQEGPQWLLDAAASAITESHIGPPNQYAPGTGLPALREAVAEDMLRRQGVSLDPGTSIMATTGATEGIAATILAFATAGSQVLCFEPHYDSYGACAALAGAELVGVPLTAEDFRPNLDAFAAAISDRTSLVLLNTPHNPTGTVFTAAELEQVVELAHRHGALIMCDEVYEQLILDPEQQHRSILSIPGASDIAVAVSSAGKSFSVTGWKVGWVMGAPALINQVRGVKQFLSFSSGPAFQWAVAQGLRDDQGYLSALRSELTEARDHLSAALDEVGLRPNSPGAGYFLLADISELTDLDDAAFCELLAAQVGVAAIPVSALIIADQFPRNHRLRRLVRFAFCKDRHSISEAAKRLQQRLPEALAAADTSRF